MHTAGRTFPITERGQRGGHKIILGESVILYYYRNFDYSPLLLIAIAFIRHLLSVSTDVALQNAVGRLTKYQFESKLVLLLETPISTDVYVRVNQCHGGGVDGYIIIYSSLRHVTPPTRSKSEHENVHAFQ